MINLKDVYKLLLNEEYNMDWFFYKYLSVSLKKEFE